MTDIAPIITASTPLINGQNGLFVLVLAFAALALIGFGTAGAKVFTQLMAMFDRLMDKIDDNTAALGLVKGGLESNSNAMALGFKDCTEANKAIAAEVKLQTEFLKSVLAPDVAVSPRQRLSQLQHSQRSSR